MLDRLCGRLRIVLRLAEVSEQQGYLRWVSGEGGAMTMHLPMGWRTVSQLVSLGSPRGESAGWVHRSRRPLHESPVAVDFTRENWMAIASLVADGCQLRGGEWPGWGSTILDRIHKVAGNDQAVAGILSGVG